jgi:hypothetical protein
MAASSSTNAGTVTPADVIMRPLEYPSVDEKRVQWSTSPVAFDEFWRHVQHVVHEPPVKFATHPFQRLYKFFTASTSKHKLALYLIFKAIQSPSMIMFGMGVISAKHEMIANRMDVKPSHMLLAICKRLFLGLQIQLPRLFGEPTNMVSGWSMNQVLKVIHLLFVSSKSAKTKKVNAISKKKEEAPAAEEEAEIDEVSIYDCIAGFVLAAY